MKYETAKGVNPRLANNNPEGNPEGVNPRYVNKKSNFS
jgi:hypothetical protein